MSCSECNETGQPGESKLLQKNNIPLSLTIHNFTLL